MLCEKCRLREATLSIWVANSSRDSAASADNEPGNRIAVCRLCAHQCEQELAFEAVGLTPGLELNWERLRVLNVTPEWTTLRLLRSEAGTGLPTDWAVLTARLNMPSLQVGEELELGFSSDTLDWLRGGG